MDMLRKISSFFLVAISAFVALPCGAAESQIKIVVPVSAGGPADAFARTLALNLAKRLQRTVIVENMPGASGVIGTEYVVRSAPDGNTILLTPELVASNVSQFQLRFDPVTDLAPVLQLTANEIFVVVNAEKGLPSLQELDQAAKQRPEGLNCGASTGALFLNCERMRLVMGGKVVSIPYPGVAPVLNSLLGGHVDFAFVPQNAIGPLLESKKIRVLAAAGTHAPRAPFDKVPMLQSTFPVTWLRSFTGLFVPAATPKSVVERLNKEVNALLGEPEMREFAARSGNTLIGGTPETLARTLAHEIDNHARTMAEAGMKTTEGK
jgi:tripartite-type tricarboxylate transporter receptor subunit TctC